MRTDWTALAATFAVLTGCSTGSSRSPAPPAEVRGSPISAFSCTAASRAGTLTAAPAAITIVRLCRTEGPGQERTVTLRAADGGFRGLITALASPDLVGRRGDVCPEYADVPQRVIADSAHGPMLVHIPVDGCDHYQQRAAAALAAARTHRHH